MSQNVVNRTVSIYIDQSAAEHSARKLQATIDRLERSIKKGEAAGKDMTKELEAMGKAKGKLEELGKIMEGKMATPLRDMRKYVQNLRRELEGMSKDAAGYGDKFKTFETASKRLADMERQVKSVRTALNQADTGRGGFLETLKGVFAGFTLANAAQRALDVVSAMFKESSRLAAEMEGVERAFNRMNRPGLLNELQKATRGTVSDLELMKKAVQFENFGLPVEKMGIALEFARRRAKDTGQDVNFLVDSIVTGIGRQSPLILDNLGINAKRVADEFKRTGNFAQAAFKIIQEESQKAGRDLTTYAEIMARYNAQIENQQAKFGQFFNNVKGYMAAFAEDMLLGNTQTFDAVRNYAVAREMAAQAAKDQKEVDKQANTMYLLSFKKFTDEYANLDFKGREKVRMQAQALHASLAADAEKYYKKGSKSLVTYLAALKQSYESFLTQTSKQAINLNSLSPQSIKGLSMEQLTQVSEAISNSENSMTSADKGLIARNLKLRTAINKEIATITGAAALKNDTKAKAAQEKLQAAKDQLQQYLQQVEAMEADAEKNSKARDEQEILRVRQKVEKLLAEFKKYAYESGELTKAQQKELDLLYAKQLERRSSEEYEASVKSLGNYFTKERNLVKAEYEQGLTSKKEYSLALEAIEREEAKARLQVATDYAATVKTAADDVEQYKTRAIENGISRREQAAAKAASSRMASAELGVLTSRPGSKDRLNAEKALEEERFRQQTEGLERGSMEYEAALAAHHQRVKDMERDFNQERIARAFDVANTFANAMGSYFSMLSQMDNASLDREQRNNEKRKEHFKALLDGKKITQEEYDRQVAASDEEMRRKQDEINRREFNRNKTLNLINATIDGAKSISGIWAAYGANPILAGILTAVSAAATGLQIATISRQQYPTYGKGRRPKRKGGVADGPSHEDGGILMVNPQTGEVTGEMEGEEAILSVDTYNNNRPVVDALLDASMNRNGAPINWASTRPPAVNYSGLQRSYDTVSMYKYGKPANTMATGGGAATATGAAIEELNGHLRKGIRAFVVYRELEETRDTIDTLRRDSSARR